MTSTRRGFIRGLGAMLAAPAIVRVASIMLIKATEPVSYWGIVHPQNIGDLIDFDAALRQLMDITGVPPSWLHAEVGQINGMRLPRA